MLSPDAICFFPPRAGKPRRTIHPVPIGRVMALEVFYSPGDSDLPEHSQKRLRIGMEGIEQRSVPIEQNPAEPDWNSSARHDGRRVANISPRLLRTLLSGQAMLPLQNAKRGAEAPLIGRTNLGQWLEREPNGKLRLQRVTNPLAQETVKIEQPRSQQRIYIILIVKAIEHLQHRGQGVAFPEVERSYRPPVEREKAIVFAQVVSSTVDAADHSRKRVIGAARSARAGAERIRSNRLCGVSLNAGTELKADGQFSGGIKIEFMPAVAVGKRVVSAEIEAIEVAEGEWVAFVGIVIQVLRKHGITFHLETLTKAFAHSHSQTAIQRMS